MKMKIGRLPAFCLAICMALSLTSCGGEGKAASMWLVKTEGTVNVSDSKDADVDLTDRLGLFSGYKVKTQSESYGWIDLDDVKLTKLDQDSRVEVNKDGKVLELVLLEGAVFFNVTKPLEEDEEMTIRSSNLVTAIRGTAGWVSLLNEDAPEVYIIEGQVEVSKSGKTHSVRAGEFARLIKDGDYITVGRFSRSDVPDFVAAEVRGDERLKGFMTDIGIDLDSPDDSSEDAGLSSAETKPDSETETAAETEPVTETEPETEPETLSGEPLTYEEHRTDYDVGDAPAEIYYEGITLQGSGEGIDKMNALFQQLEQDFFARTDLQDTINAALAPGAMYTPYSYTGSLGVTYNEGGILCVTDSYYVYTGGAHGWGESKTYTLMTDTGEQATINDVLEGSDEEIMQMVISALEDKYGEYNIIYWDTLQNYDARDLKFNLTETGVNVYFDQDEIASHAAGFLSVDLPLPESSQ